jgi:hypothetical protein
MLIDRGVTAGEVITLKLTSGEELVSKLVEDAITYYKLSRPLVIGHTPQGPGLMPYLFTVHPDKEIKILKTAVTVAEATDKQFADQYVQSTTGIRLA